MVLVCALLLLITGCTKPKETILLKEWLEIIVREMNIPQASNSIPYYLNINEADPYFKIVQASVEWGVLDTTVSLSLDDELTKEWVAYTLINLMQQREVNVLIQDVNKTQFPLHIAQAVQLGVFELDQRNCFNPKEVISKENALEKFKLVQNFVNHYEIEDEKYKFEMNEEVKEVEIPTEFNQEDLEVVFKENPNLIENDKIHWQSEEDYFYIVKQIDETKEGFKVKLSEGEYSDFVDLLEIEDRFEVDFSQAEIELLNENIEEVSARKIQHLVSKEIKVKDFEGTIEATVNGITLKLKKGDIKTEAKIYKVKPTVRWKTNRNGIEDAYFKLDFNTTELIKVEPTISHNVYADFAELKGDSFVKSLLNSFKTSEDMNGTTIPICQIKVPFPNIPLLDLTMQLKLHIYASGKVELVLVNEHQLGIEIKNNKMRLIQDSKRNADFIMKASASSTLGLTAGVAAGNVALMDLQIKGGIRGYIDTILHLYDSKGDKQEKKVEFPFDKADEASLHNKDVKVCGNINLHWILDVVFNTQKTVAAKLGLSKTWNILNETNGKIILNKKTHIENWQFMEHCSRGKRLANEKKDSIVSDKIVLEKINLVLSIGETKKLRIVGLPREVKTEDLIYTSNNSDVAQVSKTGSVTGIKRGSAIIKIQSKDNLYSVNCNILVSEKKK